jgi:hypothetical protein
MAETYTGKIVADEKKHMNKIQNLYSALFSATILRQSVHRRVLPVSTVSKHCKTEHMCRAACLEFYSCVSNL